MRVPAAAAALPLLAGIAGGVVEIGSAVPQLALLAAVAALLALLASTAAFGDGSSVEQFVALAIGYLLAGLSLGTSAAAAVYHPPLLAARARTPGALFEIEGRLREDVALTAFGPSLLVDVERAGISNEGDASLQAVTGGVRLSVAGDLASGHSGAWMAGRRIRAPASLREPPVYLDPGVRDDRRSLARRGIALVGSIKSASLVDVQARGSPVEEVSAAVRAWVRASLARDVGRWSPRSAAIATAILIGDRSGLPSADVRRLQDAGTYHVIAISGGNIAILTVLVISVWRIVRVPARPAALATIAGLLVYDAIVTAAPSVQRAIAGAIVYLAARALDHRTPALNVIAVAAIAGVAVQPASLFDPGFLLSFGATLGIVLAAARRLERPRRRDRGLAHRAARWGVELLLTTVAAEAAILPIGAALFGRVTFAGLLMNFAAIPLMAVLQTAALVALALSEFSSGAAAAAGYVAHLAAQGIVESPRLLGVLPALWRDVVPPPAWLVVAYYVALLSILLARSRPVRHAASATFVVSLIFIVVGRTWTTWRAGTAPSVLRIVFLDVGQGDATLVTTPAGRSLLIDAGGIAPFGAPVDEDDSGFDVGSRIVGPALRALAVRHLESLTLTHGDPDHIGGAPSVLQAFTPAAVWEGVPVPPHGGLRALGDAADAARINWRTVQAGDRERIDGVELRVLHPPLPEWERQRVRNEDSVVLDVRFGSVSIVLPGDIGAEGERALVARWEPAPLVVLKAPHHGSATSSGLGLLDTLKPRAVVFSAGRDNRFGHPAPPVVARYRDRGIERFSTATDGAVLLETDGSRVWMAGWTGERLATFVVFR